MTVDEIREALSQLIAVIDYSNRISALPDCNTCEKNKSCPHRPDWGGMVRINCFDYQGSKEEGSYGFEADI